MSAKVFPLITAAPASSDDFSEVDRLGRRVAAVLAQHTGLVVSTLRSRGSATAAVQSTYRLAISVGSYSILRRRPLDEDVREWQARRDAAPREIVVEVHADVEWLRDQSLATEGNFGCEHACVEFLDVETAAAWVHENCLRVPVERVSAAELTEWSTQTVVIGKGGKNRMSTISEAVKIYGPLYGSEIAVEALMINHGLDREDAELITSAVKKILPRK